MIERLESNLDRVACSAPFAYGTLLAIQAKVLWGIWEHRDLPAGDSSNYFVFADAWADHRWVDPLFSPLYTSLWGTLLEFIDDTYAATIAHRVIIVLAVTLLVLAVLRRLLSPGVAWLIAVWWALLPVNYDTLNEVHLFSLLPVLLAALVALRWSGTWMRAAVFGILLGAAVLQRNELVIASLVWLVISVAYKWRQHGQQPVGGDRRPAALRTAVPYGAAGLAVLVLMSISLWRSPGDLSLSGWVDRATYKQDFALCQHYAVGYQQRHHADRNIGWQHCQMFMERDFGSPTPSFLEAVTANPSAAATHFSWNLRLSPYAAQLGLFAAISGSKRHDPDYLPVEDGSALVLAGSVVLAAVVVLGLILLWRRRHHWWATWVRPRAWGWAVLASVSTMGIWVAITTHPRPSYVFPLTFTGMSVIGMCAMAVFDRWPVLGRLRAGLPLVALLLFLFVPSHYGRGYSNPLFGPGRPLADMVSRLEPYRDRLAGLDTRLLGRQAFEACNYLNPEKPCTAILTGLRGPGNVTQAAWLERQGINAIYADREMLAKVETQRILQGLEASGWQRIAPPASGDADWLLLLRTKGAQAA